MRHSLCFAILASAIACSNVAAQAPIGPVAPRIETVQTAERALSDQLAKGTPGNLWDHADARDKQDLLNKVVKIKVEIQDVIGPVTPRPKPTPAPTPKPDPKKEDWTNALTELQGVLKDKSKTSPDFQLPEATKVDFRALIQDFEKSTSKGTP